MDGEFIPCRVKIWAAGNNASFVGNTLGASVDRVGRVIVNDDLTHPRTSGSSSDRGPGEFFPSKWRAVAGSLTRSDATRPSRSSQRSKNDPWQKAAAISLFRQGKHGHDRTEQSSGRFEVLSSQRSSRMAGLVVRAYYFPGWLSESRCSCSFNGRGRI